MSTLILTFFGKTNLSLEMALAILCSIRLFWDLGFSLGWAYADIEFFDSVDITKDLKTMGKLKREVEKAKVRISSNLHAIHGSVDPAHV